MAHELEIRADGTASMFYAGEEPWHGLGTKVDQALTSADAIKMAGLDWDILQAPVIVMDKEVPGFRANVRSTDLSVLGITSDMYKPVQNREGFSFTDELLHGDEPVKYQTAGSLRNGKMVWLLAELPKVNILGDDINNFLVFSMGHDGKTPVRVACTPTRVVCANTLALSIAAAKRIWMFEHTGDIKGKISEAFQTLQNAKAYIKAFEEKAELLQQCRISKEDLDSILEGVYGDEESEEFKDRSMAKKRVIFLKNQFFEIYDNKSDLDVFRGSAWGVYNAFADIASHTGPVFKTKGWKERRFESFIDGNALLKSAQKAIELVVA